MAEDIYKFKLALVLGRGKRLKKMLKKYPTEKKFKKASQEEIAEVIGIKNLQSKTMTRLTSLDTTYDKMVTFKTESFWSKDPNASRIMGIDTEYLKSDLDCIQYVVVEDLKPITSGFIFTNSDLAPSVSVKEGIDKLRDVISEYNPDIFVGHNFNSDISIMENAYGFTLPELYSYDDTMDFMDKSNLANIIGGFSLDKAIEKVFLEKSVGLFKAYNDLSLLIEYGIKDALYPIFLRYYLMNGELPKIDFEVELENLVKEENRKLLTSQSFSFSF